MWRLETVSVIHNPNLKHEVYYLRPVSLNWQIISQVEHMRKAILEGLEVEFAIPNLAMPSTVLGLRPGFGMPTNWGVAPTRGRGRGPARLEIAGVVVGQWDNGSYASHNNRYTGQVRVIYIFVFIVRATTWYCEQKWVCL